MCPKRSSLPDLSVAHNFALFLPYLNDQELIDPQPRLLKNICTVGHPFCVQRIKTKTRGPNPNPDKGFETDAH